MSNAIVTTNMNYFVECNICLESSIRCLIECEKCVDNFCCEFCSVECLTFNPTTLTFVFSCPFCRRQIPFESNYTSYITSHILGYPFVVKVQLSGHIVCGTLTGASNDRIIVKYTHNGVTTTIIDTITTNAFGKPRYP